MRGTILLLLLMLSLVKSNAQVNKADEILGQWLTKESRARVEIFKKGNQYFGKIIWLKEPLTNGKPKTDVKNPQAALRQQPIVGLQILKDFRFDGDDTWEDGSIYDPESGKTYSCKITIDGRRLKVRGYIGISLLGRTEVWQRL